MARLILVRRAHDNAPIMLNLDYVVSVEPGSDPRDEKQITDFKMAGHNGDHTTIRVVDVSFPELVKEIGDKQFTRLNGRGR